MQLTFTKIFNEYLNKHKILNLFSSTSPFLLLAIKSYPEIGLDGFPFNSKGVA